LAHNQQYLSDIKNRPWRRFMALIRKTGFINTVKTALNILIVNPFLQFYWRTFRRNRTFRFRGKDYSYLYHMYSATWGNERAVEVPLAIEVVEQHKNKRILEVGNVLSYYVSCDHDVLDKYELVDGVINEDAADFKPQELYDLIVSVSTFEHIGWDEEPKDPPKLLRAITNLQECLTPDGKMFVTVPLGQNQYLDSLIAQGSLKFSEQYYLRRISADNRWEEADWDKVNVAPADDLAPGEEALVIGIGRAWIECATKP